MVGREERHPPGQLHARPVGEARTGPQHRPPDRRRRREVRLEPDPPEPHHDPDAPQQPELVVEIAGAAVELGRRRPVVRRRAVDRGRDVRVHQSKPVPPMPGCRLRRETVEVKGPRQPLAASARGVAGEHAARAVPSVSGGGQADEEEPRRRRPEARNRTRPVRLPEKAPGRRRGDGLPVPHEARAAPARDDALLKRPEIHVPRYDRADGSRAHRPRRCRRRPRRQAHVPRGPRGGPRARMGGPPGRRLGARRGGGARSAQWRSIRASTPGTAPR